MMTRKDFQLIADAIRSEHAKTNKPGWNSNTEAKAWRICAEEIALNLADALASQNPNFDRSRFLAACWGTVATAE